MPSISHMIAHVEPMYGPARINRAASLHNISSTSGNTPVEHLKINPKTNVVQVNNNGNDQILDRDIPFAFEMDFNPNDV